MHNQQKNIIVSGCTKGIGRAICDLFAANGFNVAGCARNKNDIDSMQQQFEAAYPHQQFIFRSCDVSKKDQLLDFSGHVLSRFDSIDVLVNNAGVFLPGNILTEADNTLELLLLTNVNSAYYLTRAFAPKMTAQQSGHIFNMCSVASIRPYDNGGSYCISKFALLGFSKQLREEMKSSGVKVTALIPGATLTDSWNGVDLPKERFIPATDIAQATWSIYNLSASADVEEFIIRPQLGDI